MDEEGCSNDNVYNIKTGAKCINNINISQGCANGYIFNIVNGSKCLNNNEVLPGCGYGNAYSTVTGGRCINNLIMTKYNFGDVTLKLWSRGENVINLQKFLNTKLNLGLVVDGKLGPKTTEAVKNWQTSNGLFSDGLVGSKTMMMMNL